jgi:hypothetical protein
MAKKRGPKEETLKIEGMSWQDAIAHALKKPRPSDGWPKDTPAKPAIEAASKKK